MELFVGNLPFETREEELNSAFANFGTISNVKMLTNRDTGRFRGIAFVSMENDDEAQAAIAGLNGTDFGGRNIKVEQSQPREKRPDFGNKRRSFGGRDNNRGGGRSFGGGFGGRR